MQGKPQLALIQAYSPLEDENMSSSKLFHISTHGSDSSTDAGIQKLLTDFGDLFLEPQSLPPFREGFNHQIPLLANANLVS